MRQDGGLLRPCGAHPLGSRAGGDFGEWVRSVHGEGGDPLSEAAEPMRWLYGICQREGRTDRLVNCLLRIEAETHAELLGERAAAAQERAAVTALVKENQFVRRMLENRDRQFAALQSEFLAMRRDWAWRMVQRVRCAAKTARRAFGLPAPACPGRGASRAS